MSTQNTGTITDNMGPCSLLCYTCPGYKNGVICSLSGELLNYLEGIGGFMAEVVPEGNEAQLEAFTAFTDNLERNTNPQCNGCRNDPNPGSCVQGCFILACTGEQGVSFCGECPQFPCEKVADSGIFLPTVYERWLSGNKRIKEIGAQRFFDEEKKKSHYKDFVK